MWTLSLGSHKLDFGETRPEIPATPVVSLQHRGAGYPGADVATWARGFESVVEGQRILDWLVPGIPARRSVLPN